MANVSIILQGVSLEFPLSFDVSNSVRSRLVGALNAFRRGQSEKKKFKALNNVSLKAGAGDIIGIIGPNGSGKTTLLRMIAGIYHPDKGQLSVSGKMSTILSLGTGFNNELSGRQNVFILGYLLGLHKDEVLNKMDDIIAYAELGDFIDVPVKYYSNGMISRLGFSITNMLDPEIILIDEIFSVGDLSFKSKSKTTIKNMLNAAACQIIVTHNLNFVKKECTRALYIKSGRLVFDGDPEEAVARYKADTEKRLKEKAAEQ